MICALVIMYVIIIARIHAIWIENGACSHVLKTFYKFYRKLVCMKKIKIIVLFFFLFFFFFTKCNNKQLIDNLLHSNPFQQIFH